ncbi:serine/threonine-protein kinase fray2-like [Anopheles stephensi]|uniref:serine/threonine-protein kinase fray2-like n=1 Tax=Anopheles stephensi TaxID=30069 RepID=UPI001658B946|nr:serine/threonine-protein kinase fray2-like [Anopheles stephensi]
MSNVRQCPFDPLHIISAKSFAIHLVKCKRQHPEIKLVECYFDSSHLVKEEELKQHMRTCSGRNHLLEYKTTIDRTTTGCGADRLDDPAANLIYNTDESNRQKTETGGRSLQDDTECWDDFAYEAYDPLASCKSKMQNSKTFILPNPNKFAGQMKAAAATLAETHQVDVPDAEEASCEEGSLEDNAASSEHAERKYDPPGHEVSRTRHRDVKESPSDYDDAASSSSSRRHRKDRHFEDRSSSRRYEAKDETSYRPESKGSSHRTSDRSRSDSTSSGDRKSHVYDGHYDGYTYRGSYDASRSRRDDRGERYKVETDRGRYDRQGEYHRSSSRSYDSSQLKYEPYQRSHRSYDDRPRHSRDYE